MADTTARHIIDDALALRRTHASAPALDVLDLAMRGHHGADLETEADGQPFADWLDPPSPFAQLLRDAFAPALPVDVDVWGDAAPDGRPWSEHWDEQVWQPFAARYGLWQP